MRTKSKGVLAVIISATIFGIMPIMANFVYKNGGNPIGLAFYRFLFVLPFLYFVIKKDESMDLHVTKEELKGIILVGVLGYGSTALLLFMAYSYIPSGMATTIHFMYPAFVILGCILFFNGRTNLIKLVSVVFSILGVLMFCDSSANINILGIIFAFASSITFAFYTVYVDKSLLRNINTIKLTFYLCLIATIMMFIFSLVTGNLILKINPAGWLMILVLSLSVAYASSLFQIGIKIIGSQRASILSTFEPITSVLLGILLLNENFGIRTIFGILFILVSVTLISLFDK